MARLKKIGTEAKNGSTNVLKKANTSKEDAEHKEQQIIEVSQEEVKKALKVLLTKQNDIIAMLYQKHDEYNKKYFKGQLSVPVITIDKLNNRTLGNYTEGKDSLSLENHIRFNRNFIALNSMERILETLKHEMIHQWQDEVLYAPKDSDVLKPIEVAQLDDSGNIVFVKARQKKRPKNWHNKDFKEMAKVLDIPALGSGCYGNPAKMPEPKSYNRKFVCRCVASNGYPVTIWSTREIHAKCLTCGSAFVEVTKESGGKTIKARKSHVEKPDQDAIMDAMKEKYNHFKRFETKEERDAYIQKVKDLISGDMESGTYQKGHNGFRWGFRYWIACNIPEDKLMELEGGKQEDVKEQSEEPKETPSEDNKKKKTNKKKGKVIQFPVSVQTDDKEKEDDSEMEANVAEVKEPESKQYDINNPNDIIEVYMMTGTIKKAAEVFGVLPSALVQIAKNLKIDFTSGTYKK